MLNHMIPVTYVYTDGRYAWDTEDNWVPPVIGQGVINHSGKRFRVVDVWINHEKHGGGVGEYGIYAYIEAAQGADDRPGLLHPNYYRQD